VLYTVIEDEQMNALRVLTFMRTTMADIVREALDDYSRRRGVAEGSTTWSVLVWKSV
jgi:hypothetical protein